MWWEKTLRSIGVLITHMSQKQVEYQLEISEQGCSLFASVLSGPLQRLVPLLSL